MHYFGLKLAVCMLIQPDFNMTHETKIENRAILSSEILNSQKKIYVVHILRLIVVYVVLQYSVKHVQ